MVWKKPETARAPETDLLAGFVPMAEEDWPICVEDRWPAGKLRKTAMLAYDRLAKDGEIRPQDVSRYRSGVVVVRYMAKIPEAWVHELLVKAERRMIG